jgi:hypothetical protein
MYSKLFLASLAATIVSATPLNARQAPTWSLPFSNAPSKTGIPFGTAASTASWGPWDASRPPMGTAVSSSTSTAATPNASVTQDFINSVELAATEVERYTLLSQMDPTHLKFDFNPAANPGVKPGAGGQVDLANRANFPSVIGTGISAAVGFMNPCGLNTPHIHPRASEFLVLAQGSNVKTGLILENGFTVQQNTTLSQLQGTVFPEGSIHFQFNDNCQPAVFISGLSNEDPGASSIAQNFFSIDPAILDATLGFPEQIDGDNFAAFKAAIPPPFALGSKECLMRCGIKH